MKIFEIPKKGQQIIVQGKHGIVSYVRVITYHPYMMLDIHVDLDQEQIVSPAIPNDHPIAKQKINLEGGGGHGIIQGIS